jgi:signal transduction histidine kinase
MTRTCALRRRVPWIPAAIIALGIISTAILFWASRILDRQTVSYGHLDVLMDIQIGTGAFHDAFAEALAEERRRPIEMLLPGLDAALALANTLLRGGQTEHGTTLPPVDDPAFRRDAERIAALLEELRAISVQRHAARDPASSLGKQSEAVYREFTEAARHLESGAERGQASAQAETRRLLSLAVMLWVALVVVAAAGLASTERRRRAAERALQDAHDEMEHTVLARTAALRDSIAQLEGEVAERTRAERSLKESEDGFRRLSLQFQTLLRNIPDRISLLSPDLQIRWANTGNGLVSADGVDLPGRNHCYTHWHAASGSCEPCPARNTFATGRPQGALVATADGRRWEMRTVPILREDGTVESVLEVATDVTERLALQAEAMRTAHLASIGELAAGVAHEINNPINGIINYAQILKNKSAAGSREDELTVRILREGSRISDIVRALLSFARERDREDGTLVSVDDVLSESLALTRSQMAKEGIVLQIALPADLQFFGKAREVQQVFMNVLSNARYALNEKYPGAHEDKILRIEGEQMARGNVTHVRVVFHDHGVGIPAQIVDKVLQPFFTTKPTGKGTGLGLSISHGIVADHGGKLTIDTAEGEFTRVTIDLPARGNGHGEDPRRR